jgi:hypothetical protein
MSTTFERIDDLSAFDEATPNLKCIEATWDDLNRVRYTFDSTAFVSADAHLFERAKSHVAALKAAYAEIDRLELQLVALQEDAMTIYGDNDRLTAEIDRLRANALEWVTVKPDGASYDADPTTLPDQDCGRDVLVGTWLRDDEGAPTMMTYYTLSLEDDSIDNLDPGDRWAYIPEVQS